MTLTQDADEFAAEHGEHLRPNNLVIYTAPDATGVPALIESTGLNDGQPSATVLLPLTRQRITTPTIHLTPRPELPDLGEPVPGWWRIVDVAETELARVRAGTREAAHAAALRYPSVRQAEQRDGGMASRPLWTGDGPIPDGIPQITT